MEWASHGILVNCIAPGPIDTPEAGARTWPTPELRRAVARSTALDRLGVAEEIAWLPFCDIVLAANLTGREDSGGEKDRRRFKGVAGRDLGLLGRWI